MNKQEHHREAERLLEKARSVGSQGSRSDLLAEAQVHATLALSDPPTILSSLGINRQTSTTRSGAGYRAPATRIKKQPGSP